MAKLELSENALRVLQSRYLRRDANRRIAETPEELFESVAKGVAYAELLLGRPSQARHWEEKFLSVLMSLDFLPNTPTLMNAGKPLGQLSACFVLPVEDSIEGIFEAIKQMALVQRTGGGTGFSFSRLRPKGALVETTSGEASGPVSFMQIFDCATENIKQGGKRRGANMGVLRVDHPDILEFIWAKKDGRTLRNFNISVGVTDRFMKAVRDDHQKKGAKLRNATLTAIAPTGTIGIIAGTTPSIEPLFALVYRHSHVLGEETLPEPSPIFWQVLKRRGLKAEKLMAEVVEKGHLRDAEGVPDDIKRLFVTALEISPSRHIQMQAAFQKYVDNSVSKTVNLPQEATVKDIADAYWKAWELGLKGITIYRYGSKSSQVLELGLGEEAFHYDHASKCDPEECKV